MSLIYKLMILVLLTSPIILSAQIQLGSISTATISSLNLSQEYTAARLSFPLSAKNDLTFSSHDFKSRAVINTISTSNRTNAYHSSILNDNDVPVKDSPQTSLLQEIGYILAMEIVFTGMSYLASRENRTGPIIVGCFDVFMSIAGVHNATLQESSLNSVGYYLLSAGFLAKSLYNFRYGKSDSAKDRFVTNIIGFNVLVFSGYYLDSLH